MNIRIAVSILVIGIIADAAMVVFLIVSGGVAVNPPSEQQENHPATYGLVDANTDATVQAAKDRLTALAQGTTVATPPASRSATPASALTPVAVGQSLEVEGVRYTVNSIADPEPPGFFKPAPGKRFVAVELTIEALSQPTVYGISFIDVRASDGKDYGWTNGNNAPSLTGGTLEPGQSAHGWVTLNVPAGAVISGVVAALPTKPPVLIATVPH